MKTNKNSKLCDCPFCVRQRQKTEGQKAEAGAEMKKFSFQGQKGTKTQETLF
jgi:hypothetical protein